MPYSPPEALVVTIAEKHLRVVSNILPPYLEWKPRENPDEPRYGNDRFEGFVVDFMDALAEKKNFKYTLEGEREIEISEVIVNCLLKRVHIHKQFMRCGNPMSFFLSSSCQGQAVWQRAERRVMERDGRGSEKR